ncbi:hypothetical protein D0Z00_001871 [Geotrichum galactomycetum]|uniref:Uncharacterized protein n=1 Tax=Geotrichum galactomycetum TaxID=27317 RepID=A0ACB6V5S1_9ASCO|nr:hypothetical protein D0Z00_001871 [Geotrichum candidum]
MVFMNNLSIVIDLQALPNYMTDLFAIYKIPNNTAQKREGVQLVYQLSLAMKGYQNQQKRPAFEQMISSGLLSLFKFAFDDTDNYIRKIAAELLLTVIDTDATLVRHDSQDHESLLLTIAESTVNLFIRETDIGIRSQLMEALQQMLSYEDSPNIMSEFFSSSESSPELKSDVFISSFYDGCGKTLYSDLINVDEIEFTKLINLPMSLLKKGFYENLCRLLIFLMSAHRTKCFEFTIQNKMWKALSLMIQSRHQKLQLAALQCLKQALVLEDYTLCVHLTENHLVEQVVENLVKMGNKNNLVNSSCLEILEMIATETLNPFANKNMIFVLNHLIKSRMTELESLTYTDLFAKLFKSYKSNLQIAQTVDSTLIPQTGLLLEDAMKSVQANSTPEVYQYCTIDQDATASKFTENLVISNKRGRNDEFDDLDLHLDVDNSPKFKKLHTESSFVDYDSSINTNDSPIQILSLGDGKGGFDYDEDVIEFPKKDIVPISSDSPEFSEDLTDSPPKVLISTNITVNTEAGFSTTDSKGKNLIGAQCTNPVASRPRRNTISYSNGGPVLGVNPSIKKNDGTGLQNSIMSLVLSGIGKSQSIE